MSSLSIALDVAARLIAVSHWRAAHMPEPPPDHVIEARAAGVAYDVEPELLLSIAWHESHWRRSQVEDHGGGCGVMTAEPVTTAEQCAHYVNGGYYAGAKHLRAWLDASDPTTGLRLSRHEALVGFVGGYRLIGMCRRGEVVIRPGVDTCLTPVVFDFVAERVAIDLKRAPRRRPRRRPAS